MRPSRTAPQRRQPRTALLFALLCSSYVVGIFAFFICRLVLYPLPPFMALVNSFTPFIFAPLLVCLPLALFFRARLSLLGCIVLAGVWGLIYGDLFLPRQALSASPVRNGITVMTFNLGPQQGKPDELAATIAAENADLVAVEELTPVSVQAFRGKLSRQYPYLLLDLSRGTNGLLSRYPITKSEYFSPAGQGRAAIRATVNISGTLANIFVIHPYSPGLSWYPDSFVPVGLNDADPEDEIADILQRSSGAQPTILLGDFNMTDQTRSYARITRNFRDAFREAGWGWGFTFPNKLEIKDVNIPGPFIRIDYIFHSTDMRAEWTRVDCRERSDHCYLVARLALLAKP